MGDVSVIDISHYQPTPDWEALKQSGVVGVILKCTEGQGYVDSTFRERYDAAIAAGLAVASYHFLRPGSITAQMNHYLNTLEPRQGERVCLDHEDTGVSLADLESAVQYLQTDSRNLQITIYSGHVLKGQLGDKHSDVLAETSLWLAQYSTTPSWPQGTWSTWTLWQYSDQGSVPGIGGKVDCNRFNGSIENCIKWLNPAEDDTDALPGPEPAAREIVVDLTADPGTIIHIYVNGSAATTITAGG